MPESCTVRAARPDDAGTIHDLHIRSIRELEDSYSDVQIDAWIRSRRYEGYLPALQRGEMFLAEGSEGALGFGHAVRGEILAVFVAPGSTGRGVGTRLMREALRRAGARRVHLESTLAAVGFYERHGFVSIGKKFVQREGVPIPVILMERKQGG